MGHQRHRVGPRARCSASRWRSTLGTSSPRSWPRRATCSPSCTRWSGGGRELGATGCPPPGARGHHLELPQLIPLRSRPPRTLRAWSPSCSTPDAWDAVPRVRLRGHHLPPRRRTAPCAIAFDRPEVRNAFRPRHRRRALPRARPRPADDRRRLRAAHRQRPVAEGRRLGVLLRRRSAHPRQGRLQVRRGRRRRHRSTRPAPAGCTSSRCSGSSASCRRSSSASCPAGPSAAATACTSSCDLTLASREHARFKQTDADVASFDGGYGSAYLARQVGQKFAREIFFLGDEYSAERRAPHGHGQRGRAARRARARRARVGRARSTARARPRSACSSTRST